MAELFADIDLDRLAPRGRRMLRTLAGSLALHAVFVLCLLYVPAVRDTFRLANTLSGVRFVDEAYAKTDVRERATIINLADNKLYYPPGYFEQFTQEGAPAPTATPVDDVRLVSVHKPPKPTPTPPPPPAPSPSPSPVITEVAQNTHTQASTPAASPTASPVASPTPAEPQTATDAEKALQEAGQSKFPPINTRPFTDLLKKGLEMKEAGEIDLSGVLEMTVEADRRDDGTLDKVEITGGSASDARLKELAKAFIAALSDSKALATLKDTRHLRMSLLLTEQQIAVRVVTEVETPEQARQMAQGYKGLILIGALSKRGRDEEAIFKSLNVVTDDRRITLNFVMPRKAAGELLSKLSKKTEPGPSS